MVIVKIEFEGNSEIRKYTRVEILREHQTDEISEYNFECRTCNNCYTSRKEHRKCPCQLEEESVKYLIEQYFGKQALN
ncbi:hypothetical protein LCGC14_2229870 [marine sediment metagenome]|uniref:Uncharacterized protein n=1 Tax=marine sediment metagenome TaxID=412755 RepID=A0A0F9DW88_9ZZZZ